jgi:hypothetical protein
LHNHVGVHEGKNKIDFYTGKNHIALRYAYVRQSERRKTWCAGFAKLLLSDFEPPKYAWRAGCPFSGLSENMGQNSGKFSLRDLCFLDGLN